MTPRTLLGRLLAAQAIVVLVACATLAFCTVAAGIVILRSHQDRVLLAVADQLVSGIRKECAEEAIGVPQAAADFFAEAAIDGYHFELLDGRGVVRSHGGEIGWERAASAPPGECRSVSGMRGGVESKYRLAVSRIDDSFHVRVSAHDVRTLAETRLAFGSLIFAVPVAVAAGLAFGYAAVRRELRPLAELRRAASEMGPGSAPRLGVHPKVAELADLEKAFDALLGRLGAALARERRFAQDASHELRTPLTVLRARVAWLLDHTTAGDPRLEDFVGLRDNLDALERLVDSLLLLARSDAPGIHREVVNLADIARDAAARAAASHPAIQVDAPDEALVRGDAELLRRAVENLLENADLHAGRGASIVLSVSAAERWVTLACDDSGSGVPDAALDRLFERFFRSPASRAEVPGSGLGLAVVRAVAEIHGGDSTAAPSSFGGLRVAIRIPSA